MLRVRININEKTYKVVCGSNLSLKFPIIGNKVFTFFYIYLILKKLGLIDR